MTVCTFEHPFVQLRCVRAFVCFPLTAHFSAVQFSLLAFRQTLCFSFDICIKEGIPSASKVFLRFKTKRHNKSPRKYPRNARVTYAKKLGTMSKYNKAYMGYSLSYLDNLLFKHCPLIALFIFIFPLSSKN